MNPTRGMGAVQGTIARRGMIVRTLLVAVSLLAMAGVGKSQERGGRGRRGPRNEKVNEPRNRGQRERPPSVFYTDVPASPFDVILGRPTRDSVAISVLSYSPLEGRIAFGTSAENLNRQTATHTFSEDQPQTITLAELEPNARHTYRLEWRTPGASEFTMGKLRCFHTQRSPSEPFTFTVQADSHLDTPQTTELYVRTLQSALQDAPDFHIDLGDTFMVDKRRQDYREALPQYLAQRHYFGLLCHSAPLFLVLGNHDGETARRFSGREECMAGWSNTMRKRYFPNPVPDDFYTGNATRVEPLGLLEDYYAWEWGDALFVVLDPYWFTTTRDRGAGGYWGRTLGEEQYRWLETTLEQSGANFKFVFIHNLVGGVDGSMRGGAEAAKYFEWGGRDLDDRYTFDERRPGWSAPIHDVLRRNAVNAVFHGHDHFFAHQELDGIVYQLVPQPSRPGGRNATRMAEEYGYVTGTFLPSPGYLRIAVDDTAASVAYIGTRTERAEVAFEYRIEARQPE